ncbi:MAG: helix-turn-helix domain-containing protein [Thermodesulfobacteriota bacterium]
MFDLTLSKSAKLLLLYFCRRADHNGFLFPSLPKIGRDCSIMSTSTVKKGIKELIKAGLIAKTYSRGTSNSYVLSEQVLTAIRAGRNEGQEKGAEQTHVGTHVLLGQYLPYSRAKNDPGLGQYLPPKEDSLKEYTVKEDPRCKKRNDSEKNTHTFLNSISLKKDEKANTSSNSSNHKAESEADPPLTEEKRKSNLAIIRKERDKLLAEASFKKSKIKSEISVELEKVQLDPKKKAEIERELEWTRQKEFERVNGRPNY